LNSEIIVNTDFTLFDGRQHVLGACMLSNILDAAVSTGLIATGDSFKVKSAKFIKKTGFNGRVIITPGQEDRYENQGAAARLLAETTKGPVNGWFFPDASLPVQKRLASDFAIKKITGHGDLSGTCEITAKDSRSRLRCMIEATKRLQLSDGNFLTGFPSTPVTELLFIENIQLPLKYETPKASIHVKKLSERRSSGRTVTMNRVTITQQKVQDASFVLALSFHCQG
jgi:hypothetical protein